MSTYEGRLQPSSNWGRYQLDTTGADLTSGQPAEVFLGGHWVPGHIEHGYCYVLQWASSTFAGYSFMAQDGTVCGLCVGMRVRV